MPLHRFGSGLPLHVGILKLSSVVVVVAVVVSGSAGQVPQNS